MSLNRPEPFWLCHEIDSVPHCASCNGEFIEILDSEINPDPWQALPTPPPVRPQSSPPRPISSAPGGPSHDAEVGFMQSLFGGIFGGSAEEAEGSAAARTGGGDQPSGGGRQFTFNFPGGGRGSVMFGSFNGQMGPFGPMEGDQQGGLDSFFPGFATGPRGSGGQRIGGPNGSDDPADLIRGLVQIISQDGMMPPMMGGPPGRGNLGDYVMTQQGFDDVLERLMQAAGPQGPLPAADVVIEGLPRLTYTEDSLAASPYKDCPVCKDDFSPGDEVMRVPCTHVFHPDCLQPWLKVNGSCPVCRFSLVPEDGSNPRQPQLRPAANQNEGQTSITGMLQRLWGQSGAASTSNPTSPTGEINTSPMSPPQRTSSSPQVPLPSTTSSTSGRPARDGSILPSVEAQEDSAFPTDIPDDYRERHRRREAERQHQPYGDDLD